MFMKRLARLKVRRPVGQGKDGKRDAGRSGRMPILLKDAGGLRNHT